MIVVGVYIIRFNDRKAKVTEAYTTINLHLIIVSGILENKEEEDEEGEEEAAKKDEVAEGQAVEEDGADGDVMELSMPK